jgi:hypothetical protein
VGLVAFTDADYERVEELAGLQSQRVALAEGLAGLSVEYREALRMRIVEELLCRAGQHARDQRADSPGAAVLSGRVGGVVVVVAATTHQEGRESRSLDEGVE